VNSPRSIWTRAASITATSSVISPGLDLSCRAQVRALGGGSTARESASDLPKRSLLVVEESLILF
jgi:hypothetical protein